MDAGSTVVHLDGWQKRRKIVGEPTFLGTMAYVRNEPDPGSQIMGAIEPQICWYSDLRTVGWPDSPSALSPLLEQADRVIVANFEPVQPDYLLQLLERPSVQDQLKGDAVLFQARGRAALVARPEWIRQRLADMQSE